MQTSAQKTHNHGFDADVISYFLQDLAGAREVGEDKMCNVTQLAQEILPTTAPRGQDIIHHELKSLRDDFDSGFMTLAESQVQLGKPVFCCNEF